MGSRQINSFLWLAPACFTATESECNL